MNTFSRSFMLTRQSIAVLLQEKELLLFPIASCLCLLVLMALIVVPVVISIPLRQVIFNTYTSVFIDKRISEWVVWITLYFLFFIINTVVIFFNTGLIYCASKRLSGEDPTFQEGIGKALHSKGKIIIWAAISASVGIILTILKDRVGWLARLGITFLELGWSLITYFIIPVIIFENLGIKDSVNRSGKLFKATWGENVVVSISSDLLFGLLAVLVVLIIAPLFYLGFKLFVSDQNQLWYPLTAFGVIVLIWTFLAIISITLNGIYKAALYQYASTGKLPSDYNEELILQAFKKK